MVVQTLKGVAYELAIYILRVRCDGCSTWAIYGGDTAVVPSVDARGMFSGDVGSSTSFLAVTPSPFFPFYPERSRE